MAITSERVREIFKGLEQGDGAAFFEDVADKVDWIVEGTHPLAGHYLSKQAFIAGTFAKLAKVLPEGTELHVENVFVSGDWAVVEQSRKSKPPTANNWRDGIGSCLRVTRKQSRLL